MKAFAIYHLPAILYGIAILAVSSVPNLKAPEVDFWAVDKVVHFLEYAGFAFLTFRSVSHFGGEIQRRLAFWSALALSAGVALIDELWQGFVPGRVSDPLDFLADVLGGAVTVVVLWLARSRKPQQKPESVHI